MRFIRHIALSSIFTIALFSGVFYFSCTKDACKGVTCLNNGSCGGGGCSCKPGFGGVNCEIFYRKLYSGTYAGNAAYNSTDSNFVNHTDANNSLVFAPGNDTTNFNNMSLTWNRPGFAAVSMGITLANNTPSGSDFKIIPVTVDTGTFSGSGTINATSASLNLIETFPHSTPVVITLSSFSRQ